MEHHQEGTACKDIREELRCAVIGVVGPDGYERMGVPEVVEGVEIRHTVAVLLDKVAEARLPGEGDGPVPPHRRGGVIGPYEVEPHLGGLLGMGLVISSKRLEEYPDR